MCVICVKPKGAEMPSKEILQAMYRANHDGCGFCTPTQSYKGLSFAVFMQKIKSVGKDEPCVMHFRWATHGSVKKSNCHPFYDCETGVYFAHNGVLNVRPKGDMTDSETAFRDLILPYIKKYGLNSDEVKYTINQIIGGSRFAFLQGDEVQIYGNFYSRMGCYFSNLNFVHFIFDERIYRHNLVGIRKNI